jgi:hypothetical protein
MRKRKLIPLLIAIALFVTLGVMLYLRAKAPPEAARLLPESDAIVYVQLKTLRTAAHFDAPTTPPPDLKAFIDATGIVWERDIDSAAFALHKVATPGAKRASDSSIQPSDIFTSEVFNGHFDGQRFDKYLSSIAAGREEYAGRTIYTVPMDGQALRIAIVDYDTIAASNMPTAEQIHSILDRARASALGTPGSSLLAARFHDVPLLSQAWGIGHIGLPFSQNGVVSAFGLQLPIPSDSDLVASLRYTPTTHMLSGGAVQLRIEEFAPDAATAQTTVDTLNSLLGLLKTVGKAEPTRNDGDAALREVLNSTQLEQHNQRALLNATATLEQLKAIFNAHDPSTAAIDASPTPASSSR